MKINIGSQNQVKINAIKRSILLYPEFFKDSIIKGVDVKVDIQGHPKTLEETIAGAIQRAKKAFVNVDYSVGIESGLMQIPYTKDGYGEASTCAIYNGKEIFIGVGPAFEWPPGVVNLILNNGVDGSTAFKNLKYTEYEKLGAMEGGICGYLTRGRMTREDQIQQSFVAAMIRLEQGEIYKKYI